MRTLLAVSLLVASAFAQQPDMFDLSDVVVGSQRLETRWLWAAGKWSDAGDSAGPMSAQIHCYQRFGFCEVAGAYSVDGKGHLDFDSFDILRWDKKEMIAVDSSPICIVNTLRVEFSDKNVSLSSASKGNSKDGVCKAAVEGAKQTIFLTGLQDELKRINGQAEKGKRSQK